MAQSLFVSLLPKLPFSGCVNHRRGATAVKIPSAASSSTSMSRQEYNKIIVDDLRQKGPFSLILPQSTNPVCANNLDSSYEILGSGMIILKNYVSLIDQVEIVNICQEFGGGFYQPRFANGTKHPLHMMCFGRNWDPQSKYDEPYRDGFQAPPVPHKLLSLVENSIQDAQAHLNSMDEIPSMSPDVCIANFYATIGRHGFHQDCDESVNSRRKGWPVVSISISDTAEFLYGHSSDLSKASEEVLESGDVLIFGGKSRDIYHAVKRIIPNSAPLSLLKQSMLRPGHLNLTLKKF